MIGIKITPLICHYARVNIEPFINLPFGVVLELCKVHYHPLCLHAGNWPWIVRLWQTVAETDRELSTLPPCRDGTDHIRLCFFRSCGLWSYSPSPSIPLAFPVFLWVSVDKLSNAAAALKQTESHVGKTCILSQVVVGKTEN